MIETLSLRIFWFFMLLCACTMLVNIWTPGGEPSEIGMRIAATFFIIGLASLLIWGPIITYRFYEKLR